MQTRTVLAIYYVLYITLQFDCSIRVLSINESMKLNFITFTSLALKGSVCPIPHRSRLATIYILIKCYNYNLSITNRLN